MQAPPRPRGPASPRALALGAGLLATFLVAMLLDAVAPRLVPPPFPTLPTAPALFAAPAAAASPWTAARDRGLRGAAPPERPAAPPLALLAPRSAAELDRLFRFRGFSLDAVAAGRSAVPRLYVLGLPSDLGRLDSVEARKALFLGSVLPLVLLANEEVREQRERLLVLRSLLEAGDTLTVADAAWLSALAMHYRLEEEDLEELTLRVAEVPVSLALAQAVVESGWGTSRLSREGNALFGQRAWGESAFELPVAGGGREGFRSFADLMGSVRAYLHNLNTHGRYREFRLRRAEMQATQDALDGLGLASTLERYAEAPNYAGFLRSVIRSNGLQALEGARLGGGLFTADRPPAGQEARPDEG